MKMASLYHVVSLLLHWTVLCSPRFVHPLNRYIPKQFYPFRSSLIMAVESKTNPVSAEPNVPKSEDACTKLKGDDEGEPSTIK